MRKRSHVVISNGPALCGHPWSWNDNTCSNCLRRVERLIDASAKACMGGGLSDLQKIVASILDQCDFCGDFTRAPEIVGEKVCCPACKEKAQ